MKMQYDPEVDILYVRLNAAVIEESDEIAPGVVADYDSEGNVVGLEFHDASERIEDPTSLTVDRVAA